MARKKIDEATLGRFTVKVYKDSEWGEYIARLFIDGKLYEPADAFDSDKQSIMDTAVHMLKNAVDPHEKKPLRKNPRKTVKKYVAIRLIAPNTTNGNAQRGWLIFTPNGEPVDFVDEGVYGHSVLAKKYPGATEFVAIAVTASIYRLAKKTLLKPF